MNYYFATSVLRLERIKHGSQLICDFVCLPPFVLSKVFKFYEIINHFMQIHLLPQGVVDVRSIMSGVQCCSDNYCVSYKCSLMCEARIRLHVPTREGR